MQFFTNFNNLFIIRENNVSSGYLSQVLDIIAILLVFAGIATIIFKNSIYSLISLIVLFSSIAVYYIIIDLSFIGLSYIIVYVGAVSILWLFILMLLNIKVSELQNHTNNSVALLILIGIIIFSVFLIKLSFNLAGRDMLNDLKLAIEIFLDNSINTLFYVCSKAWDANLSTDNSHITSIGNIIYTNYALWIILVSLILLLSMVGTITIVKSSESYLTSSGFTSLPSNFTNLYCAHYFMFLDLNTILNNSTIMSFYIENTQQILDIHSILINSLTTFINTVGVYSRIFLDIFLDVGKYLGNIDININILICTIILSVSVVLWAPLFKKGPRSAGSGSGSNPGGSYPSGGRDPKKPSLRRRRPKKPSDPEKPRLHPIHPKPDEAPRLGAYHPKNPGPEPFVPNPNAVPGPEYLPPGPNPHVPTVDNPPLPHVWPPKNSPQPPLTIDPTKPDNILPWGPEQIMMRPVRPSGPIDPHVSFFNDWFRGQRISDRILYYMVNTN